jgi:outer membrane protein OmpA-like peptidoglycan-associated protein
MLKEKGYGETSPKSTNDTEDGRFQNRRIQYTVVSK